MERQRKILNITKFCFVCEQPFYRSNLANHLRNNTHLLEIAEGKVRETCNLYLSYTNFANRLMTLKQSANADKRLKTKKWCGTCSKEFNENSNEADIKSQTHLEMRS